MKKNIFKWIVPALCVIGLSSCLKNKNEQPDFSATTPVVELPVNSPKGDGSPNSLDVGLSQSAASTDYFFMVNYAAAEANSKDVTVSLKVDPTLIPRFNDADEDVTNNVVILPSSAFSLPATVTIPAGQRKAKVPVKFMPGALDANLKYGLPVTITDASGVVISKNFASLVLNVAVKNKYDGVYSYTGNIFRVNETGGLAGPVKAGVTTNLSTNGSNAVMIEMHWADGGGVAGIDKTGFTIDPVTNKVTFFSSNSNLVPTAGFDNRYDPATQTFYLSFEWSASGGPATRGATLVLKYTGPRS